MPPSLESMAALLMIFPMALHVGALDDVVTNLFRLFVSFCSDDVEQRVGAYLFLWQPPCFDTVAYIFEFFGVRHHEILVRVLCDEFDSLR